MLSLEGTLNYTGSTTIGGTQQDGGTLRLAGTAALPVAAISRNGTTLNGNNQITGLTSTADLAIGMVVSGSGVPGGATITAIAASIIVIVAPLDAPSASNNVVKTTKKIF